MFLVADLAPGPLEDELQGGTTSGGNTVLVLDIECRPPQPLFRLLLEPVWGDGSRLVIAAAKDGGELVTSAPSAILSRQASIDLEWWAATTAPSPDGGLALRLGRSPQPVLEVAVANPETRLDGVRFGAIDLAAGLFSLGAPTRGSRELSGPPPSSASG